MDIDEESNLKEMRKVVEEAGMYEMDMSKEEMANVCRMIKESKNENSQLEDSSQSLQELSHIPEETAQTTKIVTNEESGLKSQQQSRSSEIKVGVSNIKDATKTVFGYLDIPKSVAHSLEIISHYPHFQTICDRPCFLNADLDTRTKLLNEYHDYLNCAHNKFVRSLFDMAPLPDAIKLSIDKLCDDMNEGETYVSRSGRHTKRKVYVDQEDGLDEINLKKSKISTESEWLSKSRSPKPAVKPKYKFQKTDTMPELVAGSPHVLETETEAPASPISSTPISKPTTVSSTKKLSNAYIMKRSSLFADSPLRNLRNKSTRCETMFDKMKEDEKKNEKTEKAMERFEDSLVSISQELDGEEREVPEEKETDFIMVDDDEPAKRRVVPPIPGRRPIHPYKTVKKNDKPFVNAKPRSAKKTLEQQDAIEEISTVTIRTAKKRVLQKQSSFDDILVDNQPSSSQSLQADCNAVSCPICAKSFPQDEIQNHAATCGEEPIITTVSTKFQQITCEICDKVFPLNTEYEVHTRDCKRRKEEMDRHRKYK